MDIILGTTLFILSSIWMGIIMKRGQSKEGLR